MCCHQMTQLGKLTKDNDVLSIWNSDIAKQVRATTDSGQLHPICKSSNNCPFLLKELAMNKQRIYKNAAYPMCLEICLPDKHCNIGGEKPTPENPACIMCRRNFDVPRQPDLTNFLCEKSRSLMPYLQQLCVMGIAEPFWKDAVFNILEKLDFEKYKQNIEFITNTNGTCLTEKVAQKFFEKTFKSEISWSIDAASPIVHQKIRRLDAYDLVVKHLKSWIKMRESYGGNAMHKVCIYNNINLLNVHEMVAMVEMASDAGVDRMIMLPTYDQTGVVQLGELLICEKNLDIFKKYSELAMIRANELGLSLRYSHPFNVVPKPRNEQLVQISLR